MKSQANSSKPRIGVVVSIAVVVGLTDTVAFLSLRPISLGLLHGALALCLLSLLLAILTSASLITGWQQATPSKKEILAISILLCIVASAGAFYTMWPSSPLGRISAERTTREFMADLKANNYMVAVERLSPTAQQCPDIINALKNPDNRPVYWDLIGGGDHWDVYGTAEFPDGVELPFKIQFTWQWSRACWRINGVTFGESPENARIHFLVTGW